MFFCEFCKISKNTFYCRTSPVAASWALSRVSIKLVFYQKCCNFLEWITSFLVMPEMPSPGLFIWGKGIFVFLPWGVNVMLVTPAHIYRKYHISTRFLIKIILFHFLHKEKISYFLEKRNIIFPDITKKIVFRCEFLGKTIVSEHLKKISYF